MNQTLRVLEAILFAATEPLTEDALAAQLPDNADLPELLAELRRHYDGRGVNLTCVDGKWAFRTAADLAAHLRVESAVARKPSRAAVETLAIIAYHQPVTRSEVEQIRGVGVSRGSFDTLLEAGWIRPVGRRRTPGRPMTWGTTPTFLQHFGLDRLTDLPGIDDLKASGLLDPRPASVILGRPASAERQDGDDADLPVGGNADDEAPPPLHESDGT